MDRDEFIKLTEKILKEQIQELTSQRYQINAKLDMVLNKLSDLEDRQGN
jgi:hypothetical protein